MNLPRLIAFAGVVLITSLAGAQATRPVANSPRLVIDLDSGWKFIKKDVGVLAATKDWTPVEVPHTWNEVDGANGKAAEPDLPEGYYRGPAWYARNLDIPAELKGKRIFVRFEGVSLVADVFVNDIPIGQHRGAFAAFCFDITPYLKFNGKDTLKVRADNSRAFDVAPLSGDFTIYGGIYRPVKLIATDPVCISPIESASPGVFVKTKSIENDKATIEVKTLVDNGNKPGVTVQEQVDVTDATGNIVRSQTIPLELIVPAESTVFTNLEIPNPHLWQGLADPYLYKITVKLKRGAEVIDEVSQPLGIRTVAITQDKGFLLNGKPYPLHGVDYHQDRADKGWATTDADRDADFAMIKELGATTIRLAHYQQAEHVHELADKLGIIEWQEIPLVDVVAGSPAFLENARQQLHEMILQCANHPAIGMWGLFNELDATWGMTKSAPSAPVIYSVAKLAKELDSTRPTVAASCPQDVNDKHHMPDAIAWNIYPGWYSAFPEDATKWIVKYADASKAPQIGISEYGAGGNPMQFAEGELKKPKADGPFHPQEWQNHVHELLWSQLKDNPRVWGTWIWVMFDFAVDKRNEGGTPGINDKGLVTRDRKIKKDTFYFYKANWNDDLMTYIVSRRATPRKLAKTDIKVYSNADEVELKLNDKSFGRVKPNEVKVCVWPAVELSVGKNKIEATGYRGNQTTADRCEWEVISGDNQ